PYALGVLGEVGGVLVSGRLVVGPPGGALQAHDVAANVGDVEREAHVRVGRDVAQLLLHHPAMSADVLMPALVPPSLNRVPGRTTRCRSSFRHGTAEALSDRDRHAERRERALTKSWADHTPRGPFRRPADSDRPGAPPL